MFERILVPLDGSELAERALEPAAALAQKFGSEVLLLRVAAAEEVLVGLPPMAPHHYAMRSVSLHDAHGEAEVYLDGIKMRLLHSGVPIRAQVLSGTAPELIVAVADEQEADLIVMSTHGRSGFSRLIYGSVAEAVLRGAHIPVLLIPIKAQRRVSRLRPTAYTKRS